MGQTNRTSNDDVRPQYRGLEVGPYGEPQGFRGAVRGQAVGPVEGMARMAPGGPNNNGGIGDLRGAIQALIHGVFGPSINTGGGAGGAPVPNPMPAVGPNLQLRATQPAGAGPASPVSPQMGFGTGPQRVGPTQGPMR